MVRSVIVAPVSFVQVEFLWFMLIVFCVYWALPRREWQNLLLVGASAVFYGWIHPWFLILLYASATLDFSMGRMMAQQPDKKRLWLAFSVCGNLGMLGFFKYFNFFVENVTVAMTSLGVPANFGTLSILLPVGISFYTFQTMSYTIDIYRGELKPRKNFLDVLVFVSFFPQLVAGPIERAANLLPQVEKLRIFSLDKMRSGFGLALWGGFKKMVVADTIAPYVDKVFILKDPQGPLVWAACLAFAVQILADFSGYTDMARGTARMLGFELSKNFDNPYLSKSTPEFWRRWHMTLSFWIRDYLLVPLLGENEQVSIWRFMWATTLTFLLLGLWHGASWNFVVLGAWNALWMILYPITERNLPERVKAIPGGGLLAIAFHVSVPGMMTLLLFRETRMDRIIQHLSQSPFAATRDQWIATVVVLGITLAASIPLLLSLMFERTVKPRLEKTPWMLPAQTSLWSVYVVMMFVFYRVTTRDFIYFQF
jgi:alginate O-acetyltransferase complex protein AlgI